MTTPPLPPVDEPWPPDTIRAVRSYLGLSSQSLAKALGLADGRTIRSWLQGRHAPTTTAQVRMARLVETRAGELRRAS